jgi:hypothetical protein
MAQRIPATVQRIFPLQLGLRGFLILCLILGASAGFIIRRGLQTPRYIIRSQKVEGFNLSSMWVRRGTAEEIVYLLAFPDGNKYGGGSTNHPGDRPNQSGVAMHPEGIFVYGKNVTQERPARYWVYMNGSGQGNVRPVAAEYDLKLDEWSNLEGTPLWSDYLRPALVLESKQFDRWWVETRGTPRPTSRFTSLETFNEWIAQANVAKER